MKKEERPRVWQPEAKAWWSTHTRFLVLLGFGRRGKAVEIVEIL